jgi:NAD-dependent deacetylase
MKKVVVLTGAGISAESGIKTFRDMGGLWESYNIEDVASIDGWYRNKELVLNFYNSRRSELEFAKPNNGHLLLAELEKHCNVTIITQNVDNLHERAGSSNIIHLHGELTKVRCSITDDEVTDIGYKQIKIGDKSSKGHQLRPHIVWFGEAVPLINKAVEITQTADILIIVGTSMQVYPAASLIQYVQKNTPIYFVDPNPAIQSTDRITVIAEPASTGVKKVLQVIV